MFVLTTGNGVDMFVLDPSIGSFVLVKRQIRIPETGKIYSVNEANRNTFPPGFSRYLESQARTSWLTSTFDKRAFRLRSPMTWPGECCSSPDASR